MYRIKLLYSLQYLLIVSAALEIYDANFAKDLAHNYLFFGLTLLSLSSVYLLEIRLRMIKAN